MCSTIRSEVDALQDLDESLDRLSDHPHPQPKMHSLTALPEKAPKPTPTRRVNHACGCPESANPAHGKYDCSTVRCCTNLVKSPSWCLQFVPGSAPRPNSAAFDEKSLVVIRTMFVLRPGSSLGVAHLPHSDVLTPTFLLSEAGPCFLPSCGLSESPWNTRCYSYKKGCWPLLKLQWSRLSCRLQTLLP